jgi:hypothetical protein
VPGSFALFGASATVKDRVFGLKNYNDATFFQNFVASVVGAFASITVASPTDVIKTRIQNSPFGSTDTGGHIGARLIKNEGIGGFFKGLVPKLAIVGPKLTVSFTIAQYLIGKISKIID